MSTSVFPNLPGASYPSPRSPVWDTTVQQAISGKETRIARQSYPRWKWDLSFSILRSSAAYTEFQQVVGFINSRQGMFDSFLYQDSDDNAVTGQAIGTGDGSTTAFQLVRAFGGFVEPMLAPNVVSAVYLAGVSIPAVGYSPPTNGSLTSTASGSLAGATYYVRSTWVTNSGETATSAETSLAVAANHILNVAFPSSPPAGAIGWNVYVSTSTATETRQNGTVIPLGNGWSESNTGLTNTGASFPLANTTGWSVSNWGTSAPGVITFAGAPGSGIAIASDFSYYWPCRFNMDSAEFSMFLNQFYELKKLSIISLKN